MRKERFEDGRLESSIEPSPQVSLTGELSGGGGGGSGGAGW